jgi:hypothetical protein
MKKSIIALAFVAFLWSNTTVNAQKKGQSNEQLQHVKTFVSDAFEIQASF